ncbi:ABC transporter ATP-binding protein [Nonomuraea sp. NPDC048916]|uniref:ABC transporter ATP-binding protein n=1 Tax=Nonomuraea sp. NPDC048916 TaxID=3154232 RepID=UPI003407D5D8
MELALDNVTVVYRRRGVETRAVRGVSLHVRKGETLAVVGESGSGKTTIAKVAAGLRKATSGTLSWRTAAGLDPPPGDSRGGRRVQMVFQHPVQSLDPLWRIRRAVREPLTRGGLPRGEADRLAAEMITRVGLDPSVLDRYPREVSGGQAQRVAIARALVSNPEIVILDEPTASLDQTVRARILTLLSELQRSTGVGYLMITHDISSVRRLATRIAVMYRGLIVESGPAATILEHARHPYTRALIAAVPVADPRVPWDATAHMARSRDGTSWEDPCPAGGAPCDEHGAGLHPVGPQHLVACTARA